MKNYSFNFIFILVLLFVFWGCSDDYVDSNLAPSTSPLSLYVEKTSYSFSASPQSDNMKINADNVPWTITNNATWLSITPNSGSTSLDVTLSVSENKSDSARTSWPKVYSTNPAFMANYSLSISQDAALPYIDISEDSFIFDGFSSEKLISVASNYDWSFITSESWITASRTHEGLKVSVSANDSKGARDAYILITAGNLSKKISITQRESNITATITELKFDNNSNIKQITLEADAEWTSQTSDWINISPTTGNAGKSEITIYVTNNNEGTTRTGFVYFYIGASRKLEIAVTQEGTNLEISPLQLNFSADGDKENLTIKSNSSWSLASSASWLTLSKNAGSGNATIEVSASPNSESSRSATISLQNKDGAIASLVTVYQSGVTVKSTPSTLSFATTASEHLIYISSSVSWTATSDSPSWLSIDRSEGFGDSELLVSVTENNTGAKRHGNIILKDSNGIEQKRIPVEQTTYDISADITELNVSAEENTESFNIKANSNWTLSCLESWITLSINSGNGNGSVKVTISKNSSRDARSGSIEVLNTNGSVVGTIIINQLGNTTIADFQRDLRHTFLSKGESLKMSAIENAAWTASVTDGDSWISVSPTSGSPATNLVVTTNENPSGDKRQGAIQVVYGYNRYTCPIIQAGKTIYLSSSSIDFFAKGGTSNAIIITADKTATITSDASWFKINQNSNSFTVTAESSSSSSMRTAIITITLQGVKNAPTQTVIVRQAGVNFTFGIKGFDSDKDWN